MKHWSPEDLAFRCQRLSLRLEMLAQTFSQLATLSEEVTAADEALATLRQAKVWLELTAMDLDVDQAFELAQIQRQLSRWHLHWDETWATDSQRQDIARYSRTWAEQLRAIAGVLV
jgi:uncharacterized Rossmann fold enzyme